MNGVSGPVNLVGLTSSAVGSSNASIGIRQNGTGNETVNILVSESNGIVCNHAGQLVSHINNSMSDDDEEMPSSPDSYDDEGVSFIGPDDVTAQLAAAGGFEGPIGMAAAAAIASAKKRKKNHSFELNPSIRKRQHTRILRKLKATIDEFSTRVGQQAVVVVATPSKNGNNFKCFGAKPLEDVVKSFRQMIMSELETALAQQAPPRAQEDPSLHELPPLVVDGIPTPVEKMTQAQLRAFIPLMLKFSTGRGKPGWGKESTRPLWWPKDVPWANVRMDARNEEQKQKVSWTIALRQIVIGCYKFHGREDLLPAFNTDEEKPPESPVQSSPTSLFPNGPTVVQTITNSDGTVSIIQVDPNNPVIHLPDGTTAHVQGMTQGVEKKIKLEDVEEKIKLEISSSNTEAINESVNNTVSIDLHQSNDSGLTQEGTIIFTSEDGTQIPVNLSGSYPVSGMITLPLPVYQTVVANIQGADGQQLQVVTPLMHVPKIDSENGTAEASTSMRSNESIDPSSAIIANHAMTQRQDADNDETEIRLVERKD